MTYPVVFHLGPVHIHAHLVFELLAYTLGYQYYQWLRKRTDDPISNEQRIFIFIGAAFGAFWGSHLLGVIERPFEPRDAALLYFLANKTIVGGLLGGLAGVEITKKFLGVTRSSGDLMAYPLMLGLAIGRLGCHLHGLADSTFGLPATLPWAIDFGDGVLRHPVNLYEILFLGLLAMPIFTLGSRWILPDGGRFKLFLISYLLWRFCLEYLKPAFFWPLLGLSSIQIACLTGLIYYHRDAWRALGFILKNR
ncbi:MAG: prolipoprotein diacylglyceryl transferase family protein [Saprospiraceae bacterium]